MKGKVEPRLPLPIAITSLDAHSDNHPLHENPLICPRLLIVYWPPLDDSVLFSDSNVPFEKVESLLAKEARVRQHNQILTLSSRMFKPNRASQG